MQVPRLKITLKKKRTIDEDSEDNDDDYYYALAKAEKQQGIQNEYDFYIAGLTAPKKRNLLS